MRALRLFLAGCFLACAWPQVYAQTPVPGTNTPLQNCVEGRALRVVNGWPACANTGSPSLNGCGTGPVLSSNATDFVGEVTFGSGIITTCTLTMTKKYSSPSLGCLAQTNSGTVLLSGRPVVDNSGTFTTLTITLTLSGPGTKVFYICSPI